VGTHKIQANYAGIPTFFQAPMAEIEQVQDGTIAVAGCPIDQGIMITKPGARHGPRAIRVASTMYRSFYAAAHEGVIIDIDKGYGSRMRSDLKIVDVGDFDINPMDIMQTTQATITGVEEIVKRGGFPVVLGGDHYIAYPGFEGFVRGMQERKPGLRVGYLHIDTHPDFRDQYGPAGGRYSHGTAARRISENPAVSNKNMSWLGINGSVIDLEAFRVARERRLKMLTVRMMRERGIKEAIEEAMEAAASSVDAVYLTIDIDVVSASEAPGTGAPVFTGLTALEFLEMMDLLSQYDIIKAVDLCEVSPPLDQAGVTADLACTALLTLLDKRMFERVEV